MVAQPLIGKYKAASFASCEVVWLRSIVVGIEVQMNKAMDIECDNQSCIAIAKNLVYHS